MIRTMTLQPSRIGCPSIPGTMKGIVMSVSGVKDVKIYYEERSLDVTYEDTQTSPEEIIKKVGREMGLALEVARGDGTKREGTTAETCPM